MKTVDGGGPLVDRSELLRWHHARYVIGDLELEEWWLIRYSRETL